MSKPLILFNPKLPKLSKNEKQVLDILVEAGKLIVPIYEEQEKQAGKVSRAEMEKAGKKNPAMLSPYTVVEKVAGKIVATPYHIKYAKLLKPIAEKLNEAARISENKQFANALRIQAKALLNGSYEKAFATWQKTKQYILDISIGPNDHFDDKLFFGKASYQAWVGVLDMEGTKRLHSYMNITLSARRKALIPNEHPAHLDKVKAKVIDVALLSGFMARTKFTGVNLPVDVNIVEKYGSEITLFNQPNDLRVKEQILPIYNRIFPKVFRQDYGVEDLRRGYLRAVALHEQAHSFLYYKNAAKNLEDLFPCIYELAATTLGLRMAGSLLLIDRINNKQLESMIVAFISRSFYLMGKGKNDKAMNNYTLGSTIFINFMFESGAIKRLERMIVPNFMKIFISIHDLSLTLEHLLSRGIRKDAELLIRKYSKNN